MMQYRKGCGRCERRPFLTFTLVKAVVGLIPAAVTAAAVARSASGTSTRTATILTTSVVFVGGLTTIIITPAALPLDTGSKSHWVMTKHPRIECLIIIVIIATVASRRTEPSKAGRFNTANLRTP